MRQIFIFLFLLNLNLAFSQTMSPERISKIKNSTVRVTIENSNSMGTGFFINANGLLLTCWHVIEPSIIKNATGKVIGLNKIFITMNDTLKVEVGIPTSFFNDENLNKKAFAFDFCTLVPIKKIGKNVEFLKLGNFDNLKEGQDIYTCGFPIGIEQKFVSRGMVSTKYIDSNITVNFGGTNSKFQRQTALLDLTMNRGNSGGAIMTFGETIDKDEVIGIADFIINPIGGQAENLIKNFDNASGAVKIGGIDPNQTFSDFTKVLSSLSIGVSGCVSINHIQDSLN
jgi:serine protease Do